MGSEEALTASATMGGLTVEVRVDDGDPWVVVAAAVAAYQADQDAYQIDHGEPKKNSSGTSYVLRPPLLLSEPSEPRSKGRSKGSKGRSQASRTPDQIREVAREVCVDGRFHERREIVQACREAGLTVGNLNSVLRAGGFEKDEAPTGRPVYRDTNQPRPKRVEIPRPDLNTPLPPGVTRDTRPRTPDGVLISADVVAAAIEHGVQLPTPPMAPLNGDSAHA